MAFRPKSPNDSDEPRQAFPVMRPRCCFLNLTFLGINMADLLSCQLSVISCPLRPLATDYYSLGFSGSVAGGSCRASCFQPGCGGAIGGRIGAPPRFGMSVGAAC